MRVAAGVILTICTAALMAVAFVVQVVATMSEQTRLVVGVVLAAGTASGLTMAVYSIGRDALALAREQMIWRRAQAPPAPVIVDSRVVEAAKRLPPGDRAELQQVSPTRWELSRDRAQDEMRAARLVHRIVTARPDWSRDRVRAALTRRGVSMSNERLGQMMTAYRRPAPGKEV